MTVGLKGDQKEHQPFGLLGGCNLKHHDLPECRGGSFVCQSWPGTSSVRADCDRCGAMGHREPR